MTAEIQTLAALTLVALAATWLVRRAFAKKKNSGCGSDCGCSAQQNNTSLNQSSHKFVRK